MLPDSFLRTLNLTTKSLKLVTLNKVVPHLHGEHKLSPIEYYQKFANTQKGGGPEIIDIESEGDDSEGEETAVAPPPTLLDQGQCLLFDDWSNQCEIECKICQESFTKTGFDALALHLRVGIFPVTFGVH